MVQEKQANKTLNFTWKLPVDLGFRYLVRFHFCELEYEIEEGENTEFSIFVNEEMAEAKADVIKWSGGSGLAVHRDYVVMIEGDRTEGKRDLLISLCPYKNHNHEWTEQIDAILKGLEIFKLSNPDKNLAGVNPVPPAHASTSINPNPRKFVFASGGNAIATGVVIVLTVLNIIVYQLRILGEDGGEKNLLSPPYEGLCRRFSLAEVLSVTNNFDNELVIGRGGFGEVYKALIDGGATIVAMKRLNSMSKQGAAEFWTEIDMLSSLRHTHLVSLIGYCDERNEMILIYEYMEHGTLADHLYKINASDNGIICHLSWEQRLNICIGAARGLDYLHTGTQHGIIHRDVKTTNILLDKDWIAKIADFGLCKMGTTSHSRTHVSTNVKGTFGYLDPEYFLTRRLTKKSDVFALGVVMLEVLCGRPAVNTRLVEEQHSLVLWAQQCIKEKKLDQIIDPSLKEQISPQCLKVFAEVVNKCIQYHPNGRPTMSDVVVSLECVLGLKDQCRDSSTVEDEKEEEVEEEEEEEEEEDEEDEEDASVSQVVDEQIERSTEQHNALPQDTPPSTSTLVQFNENAQGQKRSKRNLFQRSIAFLAKGMDTRWKKRGYDSLSNSERLQWDNATRLYRQFSIAEIQMATNNFDGNLFIKDDGFGKFYKGWIDQGTVDVAVKCLNISVGEQLFWVTINAMQTLSQLSHPHITSLIGYCDDEGPPMLVYNYLENRSLQNHLYPTDGGKNNHHPLSWKKRLEICIGAARGLQYLHSGTKHKIIHRDIMSNIILLDKNWVAKVSYFGLAKVLPAGDTHFTTRVVGTIGYLDREYLYHGQLTEKSDVYSFGVVLLEVLCARKPYGFSLDEDHEDLARWFKTCVQRKRIDQVIDPYLVGRIAPECLREFVKIAWNCLLDWRRERPSMDEVVGSLQIALQLQQTWQSDIEVDGGAAHNDPEDEWFRSTIARAYNNMLLCDNAFDVGDSDFSRRNISTLDSALDDRESDISEVSFSALDSD